MTRGHLPITATDLGVEAPKDTSASGVKHSWPVGGTQTFCGLPVSSQLKIRSARATQLCKRCLTSKRTLIRKAR